MRWRSYIGSDKSWISLSVLISRVAVLLERHLNNRQNQFLNMHLLISFLPSAIFKTSGTWTQAGLRHSFHRNIESLGLDKTLHSFTQDNQFLSVSFQLYTGQPPSDWDLIPSSCIGRQRKQSIPWFSVALMKTYFTPTQATFPLKWRPLAYVVISSTETISLRLEKGSCFLTSTTSCCHSTKGLAALGDSSGVLGHVQCGGEV